MTVASLDLIKTMLTLVLLLKQEMDGHTLLKQTSVQHDV